MKNRFQGIYWMACVLFLICVPNLHSETQHAFYISDPDHHVHEFFYDGSGWVPDNDLTSLAGGHNAVRNSALTSLWDGSVEHVFFVSAGDNHVRELYYWNNRWHEKDLLPNSNPAYPFALTSFWDGSVQHVFYISLIDRQGRGRIVFDLFNDGTGWHPNELTPNGPYASPYALTSFFDRSDGGHVFYISDNHNVQELSYNGHGGWQPPADLNRFVDAAVPGQLTSLFDSQRQQETVFYIGTEGDLHVLFKDNYDQWQDTDLTLTANQNQTIFSPNGYALTSFYAGADIPNFYGVGGCVGQVVFSFSLGSNGHREPPAVLQNCQGPWGDDWGNWKMYVGPEVSRSDALTSYYDGTGAHVFYIDHRGHVIELYFDPNSGLVRSKDLTNDLRGRTAEPWGLTSFFVH